MFWQPNKTIFTGPRKQRGNIVIGVGLPPTRLVDVNGDYLDGSGASGGGGWTVDAEYQFLDGDLQNIWNAFDARGGRPRESTLAWSPDGSKLTLSSSSSDDTICFNCSTPFDPNTASVIFSYGVTNPGWGQYNAAGNRWVENVIVGDTYKMYTASGFVITNGTPIVDNEISKADVGFNASSDAPAVFGPNFDYMLWLGRNNTTGDALRDISIPAQRLENFVIAQDGNQALDITSNPASNLDASERFFMRGSGSPGVAFYTMDGPRDVDSVVEGAAQNINSLVTFDFRPGQFWFDPADTRFVWACADPSGNFQMVRFATNVPTF